MIKLNAIQKNILKTAVAHAEKYAVDQPITVMSENHFRFIDEYVVAQRKYFTAMNDLIVAGLIERESNTSFAYIRHYGKVREALSN